MKLLSLEDFLKIFFETHKSFLLHYYPGLTFDRLKIELKQIAFLNGIDCEEIFNFPYLPHRNHSITVFFNKLKEGVPLEYISGHAYFYKTNFKVTSDVLIPRSETEILVETTAKEIKSRFQDKTVSIADVGTGSGAIILSIMMEINTPVIGIATDISEKALEVARENYFNLQYSMSKSHQLEFIKCDRLVGVDRSFDVIVSNPPYIKKKADIDSVHLQVREYEPSLALFLDDDIYEIWFEDFFKSIHKKLNQSGFAIIEGHENHLDYLRIIAEKMNFLKVSIINDYTQRPRFLKLEK